MRCDFGGFFGGVARGLQEEGQSSAADFGIGMGFEDGEEGFGESRCELRVLEADYGFHDLYSGRLKDRVGCVECSRQGTNDSLVRRRCGIENVADEARARDVGLAGVVAAKHLKQIVKPGWADRAEGPCHPFHKCLRTPSLGIFVARGTIVGLIFGR